MFPHYKSPRLVPEDDVKIIMGSSSIEWSKEVVYLGMTIDRKLIIREHVEKTVTKCNILLRSLYPLINRRSRTSLLCTSKSYFR